MKQLMVLLLGLVLTVALGPVALAQNAPSGGTGVERACTVGGGSGSCFVPLFEAEGKGAGSSAGYGGSGNSAVYQDCCVPGDTYKVQMKNPDTGDKDSDQFTSSSGIDGDCRVAPYSGQRSLSVKGAKKAKMKAVKLPGGIPAAAYIGLNGSWKQTKGKDACGF